MSETTRVVQVTGPGQGFELVEREVPVPDRGEVLVRVEACGICHSDSLTVEGHMPGIQYPRVPGHEVIGVIDAIGGDVPPRWTVGQRVGVGWHAWHCGYCDACRRGNFFACENGVKVSGL